MSMFSQMAMPCAGMKSAVLTNEWMANSSLHVTHRACLLDKSDRKTCFLVNDVDVLVTALCIAGNWY